MTYSEKITVMVGSKIIDRAMRIITKGELAKATTVVMSGSLQLLHTGSNGTGGGKGGDPFLPKGWHCGGEEILPGGCLRPSLHHIEGHHPPIWYSKCALQYQCQNTLYVGPCAHRTDTQSPVTYSSGADYNLQRVTSGVLSGTHLSAQLKQSFHQNPHKDCGWPSCAYQPIVIKC